MMWAEAGGIPRHAALRRGYKCRCGIARNPEPVTTGAWARDVPRFQDPWELGFGLCAQGRTSSRQRVDLLVREASRHDRRSGSGRSTAALPAMVETSGPGPSLPVPAARTRNEMSSSSSISLAIDGGLLADEITCSGSTPGGAAGFLGRPVEALLRLLLRLRDHRLADADPLEIVGRSRRRRASACWRRSGSRAAPRNARRGRIRASRRPRP